VTDHTFANGGRVARIESARRTWPNGVWGMVLFLATEAALFGLLIVSYFYLRISVEQWPPRGTPEPEVAWPLILLAVLVASSVPMQVASSAARRGARAPALTALAVALALQVTYLVAALVLFRHDLHAFSPRDNAYGSAYYTLLAVHHAHVVVGVLLTAFVLTRVARGLTVYRADGVRVTTYYWHVVNALAVLVTLTVLSPALA
jgi:cytochrome c oxidase subunit III